MKEGIDFGSYLAVAVVVWLVLTFLDATDKRQEPAEWWHRSQVPRWLVRLVVAAGWPASAGLGIVYSAANAWSFFSGGKDAAE